MSIHVSFAFCTAYKRNKMPTVLEHIFCGEDNKDLSKYFKSIVRILNEEKGI